MPNLSVSATNLTADAALNLTKGSGLASGGHFADSLLALLGNTGASSHSDPASDDAQDRQVEPADKKRTPSPVAAAVDAPLEPRRDADPAPARDTSSSDDSAVRDDTSSKPAVLTSRAPRRAQGKEDHQVSASDRASLPAKLKANDSTKTDDTDETATDDPLQSRLRSQLDAISQLLAALVQAISAAGQPVPVDVNATGDATAVVTDPSALAAAATSSATAGLVPGAADLTLETFSDPIPGAPVSTPVAASQLAVLKDMQAIVQQLQQLLQPADAAASAASVSDTAANQPAPDLQALLDKLTADLGDFVQAKQQTEAQPTVGVADATSSAFQLDALKQTVTDVVSQFKGRLQQLHQQNEAAFAAARAAFAAQLGDATTPADTNANANNTAATAPLPAPSKDAAETPVVAPLVSNITIAPVAPTPVAVAGITVQSDNAQNGSSNNNQGGQQQSMPQAVASVATPNSSASTAGAGATSFARVLSQTAPTERTSIPEQVTFHVKSAVSDGSSRIHIQLDPAELGKLDIRLHVGADGKTGVTVIADNQDTLNLLQKDAQGLARALSDAGLKADAGSLSFNLRGEQNPGQNQGNSQAAMNYQKSQPDEEDPLTLNPITRSYSVNLSEGLDIKI